jgi:hypothetical protein
VVEHEQVARGGPGGAIEVARRPEAVHVGDAAADAPQVPHQPPAEELVQVVAAAHDEIEVDFGVLDRREVQAELDLLEHGRPPGQVGNVVGPRMVVGPRGVLPNATVGVDLDRRRRRAGVERQLRLGRPGVPAQLAHGVVREAHPDDDELARLARPVAAHPHAHPPAAPLQRLARPAVEAQVEGGIVPEPVLGEAGRGGAPGGGGGGGATTSSLTPAPASASASSCRFSNDNILTR